MSLPSLMSSNFSNNNNNNQKNFLNKNNNYNNNNFRQNNRPSTPPGGNFQKNRTGHAVKMRGLPFNASDMDIREFFKPLELVSVNFTTSRDGRPSGECECDFATHNLATEAMKYDKKFIGSRYIELFLLSTPDSGGSRSSQQTAISLGSFMSKDFTPSKNNNTQSNNNNNNFFNDFSLNGYTSFESGKNAPMPVPPPPIMPQQSNKPGIPSLLGPLPLVQPNNFYNQQQQTFSNNNNNNNNYNKNNRRF